MFFKQKTAYEMRISDWSSDVCSSDLRKAAIGRLRVERTTVGQRGEHIAHHIIVVERLEPRVVGAEDEIERAVERGLQAEFLAPVLALRLTDIEHRNGVRTADLRIAKDTAGRELGKEAGAATGRTGARRVGKECGVQCRSRRSPDLKTKNKKRRE